MTEAKFDIEKFDRTGDFRIWRIKMRALLIQRGCKAALEVLPADMEAQMKAELNKKAHSAMILCLCNKVLREKKLYTFYMLVGRKIFEHIDDFNKIVLDLANIKVKFKDEDLDLLLLTSLRASYKHFVVTFLYVREALILEGVMATLNSKEIKEMSKAKGDDGEGIYVRGKTDRQSRGKPRLKSQGGRLKCYICQSDDHLKRNCPKNNRKKSTGYVKKDDQPSSNGSIYDNSEVMTVMSAETLLDWIMNSGCSYHMTPRVVLSGTQRDKCVYNLDGHVVESELNASVEEKDSLAQKQLVENQTGRTVKKLRMDNVWIAQDLLVEKKTPIEIWSGHPSDYGMLRIFGCVAYSHVKQGKLKSRAIKCVLLGYPVGVKDSGAGANKSVEELQVEVELQGLNNHTLEEDQTYQEDG
nr:retrovirus-related Pol polyprotein from transposon TNT 1-94 [Tanacetum cinerariifolium]